MKEKLTLLSLALLLAISSFSQQADEKNVSSPALLVIDVQKEYLPMMSQEDQEKSLEMMNWSIWLFRQYDLPVIRVYHTSKEYGPEPGSEGFAFHDSLKVLETDPIIIKTYGSAFNKTELDSLLSSQGLNTLFMCGLSSTGCVIATYFDASNYDYKAFLVKDALLGPDPAHTNNVEEMFEAVSLNTVNYMLGLMKE